MASASSVEALLRQLEDLSRAQIQLIAQVDTLVSAIAAETNGTRGQSMVARLEELEDEESKLVASKQNIRQQLLSQKEQIFDEAEKQRRRRALERRTSLPLFNASMVNLRESVTKPEPTVAAPSTDVEIDPANVQVSNTMLGMGQFGTVYRGEYLGTPVAVKKLRVQRFDDPEAEEDFKKEARVMSALRHPNLLTLMGVCTKPGNLMMVMEYMSRGDVYTLLHDAEKEPPSFKRRMLIAQGAVQGLNWLHEQTSLLHLDLKTANLLVNDAWQVKVGDFGMSRLKQEATRAKVGSPLYMAPEMLRGQPVGPFTDVYSFGVVLWELATTKIPYEGQFKHFHELEQAVGVEGKRPTIPASSCAVLRDLLTACWETDPQKRPTFTQMLKDDLFSEIILCTLISEPNAMGRLLWRGSFKNRWNVPWEEFLGAFTRALSISRNSIAPNDPRLLCLKAVLRVDETEGQVTVESFAAMLEWFGPMDGAGMLDRMLNLLGQRFFHGFLPTAAAEKLLNSEGKKGSYLLRFSNSSPGGYSLTVLNDKLQIMHYRIAHVAGGKFSLFQQEFDSLDKMLAHKPLMKQLGLKNPCSASTPFEPLLAVWQHKISLFGYSGRDDTDE